MMSEEGWLFKLKGLDCAEAAAAIMALTAQLGFAGGDHAGINYDYAGEAWEQTAAGEQTSAGGLAGEQTSAPPSPATPCLPPCWAPPSSPPPGKGSDQRAEAAAAMALTARLPYTQAAAAWLQRSGEKEHRTSCLLLIPVHPQVWPRTRFGATRDVYAEKTGEQTSAGEQTSTFHGYAAPGSDYILAKADLNRKFDGKDKFANKDKFDTDFVTETETEKVGKVEKVDARIDFINKTSSSTSPASRTWWGEEHSEASGTRSRGHGTRKTTGRRDTRWPRRAVHAGSTDCPPDVATTPWPD
jgi:hypothetical protein